MAWLFLFWSPNLAVLWNPASWCFPPLVCPRSRWPRIRHGAKEGVPEIFARVVPSLVQTWSKFDPLKLEWQKPENQRRYHTTKDAYSPHDGKLYRRKGMPSTVYIHLRTKRSANSANRIISEPAAPTHQLPLL